jgi:hypothetical protein
MPLIRTVLTASALAALLAGSAVAQAPDAGVAKLTQRLMGAWELDCSGDRSADVQVRFKLGPGGALVGAPEIVGAPAGPHAAADSAVQAVLDAAPFSELSPSSYAQGLTLTVRFSGDQACRGR